MAAKFGTSGLRGLSSELVGPVSALYATAFARMLLEKGHLQPGGLVLIGQDFRPSSPQIAATVMAALRRAGLMPLSCGALPTPALAFYGHHLGAAAMMVTGSHIPADRNGIKFYRPDGEIDKADEEALTALATTLVDDETANRVEEGSGEDHSVEAMTLFFKRYAGLLAADAFKGRSIGVYQHSSVAREMLVQLLDTFGAKVVPLGWSDDFIPVDTEAVSQETLEKLAVWAGDHDLDAIVSTDGDADRPLLADETGQPLRGDLLGLITAEYLNAATVVTPVTSNSGIEHSVKGKVIRTRVGSPYVIAAMQQAVAEGADRVMGFEANGGLMLATDFPVGSGTLAALPTRDCILPLLATLSTAFGGGLALSDLVARTAMPVALADRLEHYAQERSSAFMAHLRSSEAAMVETLAPLGPISAKSDIDGLRLTLSDGRIVHFRPSGNAPEMRCYVEAATLGEAEDLLRQGLALLSAWQA
ncbi:phosphomannomutase [Allorhizobium sp. BGMRC 0089]|uniref:phosphomannomutase n=1 Tax=Allorhizobium sonneratiae TaxID=2934936 RepID=UPI00203440AB|nr:phosphomannomutase [Allorhizobium sonneratiae]MCM2291648.1 phosphomannomutase [Allorhizobium sonneratiae]